MSSKYKKNSNVHHIGIMLSMDDSEPQTIIGFPIMNHWELMKVRRDGFMAHDIDLDDTVLRIMYRDVGINPMTVSMACDILLATILEGKKPYIIGMRI